MARWLRTFLGAGLAAGLSGCGDAGSPDPAPTAARITIEPSTASIAVGDSTAFRARIESATGDSIARPVAWRIDPSTAATVSSSGIVTALSRGHATLTATADDVSATASIDVTDASPLRGSWFLRETYTEQTHGELCSDEGTLTVTGAGAGSHARSGNCLARDGSTAPNSGTAPIGAVIVSSDTLYFTRQGTPACGYRGSLPGAVPDTITGALTCSGAGIELEGSFTMWRGSAGPGLEIGPIDAIAVGVNTSCAVAGGKLFCWGANDAGQAGDGSLVHRPLPRLAAEPNGFIKVAITLEHACALTGLGEAYCWGAGASGQLGNGAAPTGSLGPVPVAGSFRFVDVQVGALFSCGLTLDGSLYCWGNDGGGQFGTGGSNSSSLVPVAAAQGRRFASVVGALTHVCGIEQGGDAYCWGDGLLGQLGNGSATIATAPALVTGGHRFIKLSVSDGRTCGLEADGTAFCWGYNVLSLGVGSGAPTVLAPTLVATSLRFTDIAVGTANVCGRMATGELYCWGGNAFGEFGNGSTTDSDHPILAAGGIRFQSVSLGFQHACGIGNDGLARCWGANGFGQIGIGTIDSLLSSPRVVTGQQ